MVGTNVIINMPAVKPYYCAEGNHAVALEMQFVHISMDNHTDNNEVELTKTKSPPLN